MNDILNAFVQNAVYSPMIPVEVILEKSISPVAQATVLYFNCRRKQWENVVLVPGSTSIADVAYGWWESKHITDTQLRCTRVV